VNKLADIVILDGNPLVDISNVLKVKMVIKGGQIVVDKR
jgi:imidazolonepropionase-like amidohydrolase